MLAKGLSKSYVKFNQPKIKKDAKLSGIRIKSFNIKFNFEILYQRNFSGVYPQFLKKMLILCTSKTKKKPGQSVG